MLVFGSVTPLKYTIELFFDHLFASLGEFLSLIPWTNIYRGASADVIIIQLHEMRS